MTICVDKSLMPLMLLNLRQSRVEIRCRSDVVAVGEKLIQPALFIKRFQQTGLLQRPLVEEFNSRWEHKHKRGLCIGLDLHPWAISGLSTEELNP